jgi:hypothetical protein
MGVRRSITECAAVGSNSPAERRTGSSLEESASRSQMRSEERMLRAYPATATIGLLRGKAPVDP